MLARQTVRRFVSRLVTSPPQGRACGPAPSRIVLAIACLVVVGIPSADAQFIPDWPGPTQPVTVAGPQGEAGFRAIYRIDRDGKNVQLLASAPGMMVNTDPALSPDGRYVMFGAVRQHPVMGNARLFVTAIDGPLRGVTRDYGHGISPTWSPEGKEIAYVANPGNPDRARVGVWVMNADGTNRRWLSEAFFPKWSPQRRELVVHLWARGGSLGLLNVDTGRVRDLLAGTDWKLHRFGGNWSPDGNHVAFVGIFEGKEHMALVDIHANSSAIRILATNDESGVTFRGPPAWSPDGKQLVFEQEEIDRRRKGKSYLYSMSAEILSAPVLLEGQKIGNISRMPVFSADSKWLVFSSER